MFQQHIKDIHSVLVDACFNVGHSTRQVGTEDGEKWGHSFCRHRLCNESESSFRQCVIRDKNRIQMLYYFADLFLHNLCIFNLSTRVAATRTLPSLSVKTAATSESRRERCCSNSDGLRDSNSLKPNKALCLTLAL